MILGSTKMARRQVLEVTCDRCSRTETQPTDEFNEARGANKTEPDDTAELQVYIPGLQKGKIVFTDLCRRCRTAVHNYVKQILKVPREQEEEPKATGETGVLGVGGKNAERASSRGAT